MIGTMSVVIGAVVNIILDPILIYVFHMGVRGAAIATVTAQFISCIWIVHFLSSEKSGIRICLKDMRPDRQILLSTCALGVSPCTFRINESIVVILLNRLLLAYGGEQANLHLASMAILSSASQVFFYAASRHRDRSSAAAQLQLWCRELCPDPGRPFIMRGF